MADTKTSLGDVVNSFRSSIDLERINTTVGPNLAEMLQIPFTYCWSPALVPKPGDWPSHIGTQIASEHCTFTA